MLLKYTLSIFALNFASILNVENAGASIITPTAPPIIAPGPIIVPPTPIITTPIINPPITQPIVPPLAQIVPATPILTFVPTTLPQINFRAQSTTIQPLAAAYQLAAVQESITQAVGTQSPVAQSSNTQIAAPTPTNNSLANELQKANEELDIKHKKEYEHAVQDNIQLLKQKESVLIQLHAQLKLQLEAQKFAAQQRARAIKEMQEKLKQEEMKSKKDAEEMKLNVQSIVDLSPLVLNINQPKLKKNKSTHTSDFDFTNLKNVQKSAKKCKKIDHESDCKKYASHCTWSRIPKQKKHKCLFMCEKLSKDHCKKVSGCYFKNHNCRNK